MGVYLSRFCESSKLNVYEFLIAKIDHMKISIGIWKIEIFGTDYRPLVGWRFSLDWGVIDHAGEEL